MNLVTIALSRLHYPVTVLGPGKRIGIWLQGCSNRCPGCISRDTWEVSEGHRLDIRTIISQCIAYEKEGIDGITISGGEPFEQSEALEKLLIGLHDWTDSLQHPIDYLCYSGKSYDEIAQKYPNLLKYLDVLIPEPFREELPIRPLRGSSNQPIICLTELGRNRFTPHLDEDCTQSAKQMQFVMDGESVWFIGIPDRGDMKTMTERCKASGLTIQNVSWE